LYAAHFLHLSLAPYSGNIEMDGTTSVQYHARTKHKSLSKVQEWMRRIEDAKKVQSAKQKEEEGDLKKVIQFIFVDGVLSSFRFHLVAENATIRLGWLGA
jgi:hypothetical protein